jgi:hypothetical protein
LSLRNSDPSEYLPSRNSYMFSKSGNYSQNADFQ